MEFPKTVLIALMTVTVALAGCTDPAPAPGTDGESKENPVVDLGTKGAISGLVVDDNFRPVELKEEWSQEPGDYQDIGFVLILETGQRFETNENGEFTVLPLNPGTYTLRVAADVHEAKDTVVQVVAGEYTEVTVEARRQFSGGGAVFSNEQVLFMACYGTAHVAGVAVAAVEAPVVFPNGNGCGMDISGDSSRFDFFTELPALAKDTRGLVTEMRASESWSYSITTRIVNAEVCDYSLGYCYFGSVGDIDTDYLHSVLYTDLQYVSKGEYLQDGQEGYCKVQRDSECERYAFTMDHEFQTALFADHPNQEQFSLTCPYTQPVRDELPYGGCRGVGVALGVKAQFIQNIFLYELPEEGIEDYCVLCEDADIPA